MDDGAFGFAHAIFHLVLVAVTVMAHRCAARLQTCREQMKARRRNKLCGGQETRRNKNRKTKGNPMKPVIRYQSQLLFRRAINRFVSESNRRSRSFVFRPARFGVKPQSKLMNAKQLESL